MGAIFFENSKYLIYQQKKKINKGNNKIRPTECTSTIQQRPLNIRHKTNKFTKRKKKKKKDNMKFHIH